MAGNLKNLARERQDFTNEQFCHARAGVIRALEAGTSLIPEANPGQAEFETQLLDVIGRGMCPQDSVNGVRQPFGIVSLTPRKDEIEISLGNAKPSYGNFSSFVKFILYISPIFHEDEPGVSGIPALRVRFTPRGAVMTRLTAPGKVVIRGVTENLWNSALMESIGEAKNLSYLGNKRSLHPNEAHELESQPRGCDSTSDTRAANLIISGILRRSHAFRANSLMKFVDLWFDFMLDRVIINIEWAGDLSHFDVIRTLTDKRFGLPLKVAPEPGVESCFCEPCTANTYAIRLRDYIRGCVKLDLRRNSIYDHEYPPRVSGSCRFRVATSEDGLGSRRRSNVS